MPDPDLLPTPADVEFFAEHGWYRSPRLFSEAELTAVIAEQDAFYDGKRVRDIGLPWPTWNKRDSDPLALRKHDYASLTNPLFFDILVAKPTLAQTAARLLGSRGVRLWHDQLLYKPALPETDRPINGQRAVGWHTDELYWKTCSGPLVTAWIAFTDCPEAMGPIAMIDGSHRWPDNSHDLNFFSDDLDGLAARFHTGGAKVQEVPMTLAAGEVSFHSWRTIHGSQPNRSGRPRRSIAIHLQALENSYVRRIDPKSGKPHGHANDGLVRKLPDGSPDYADPTFCPVLWPR